MSAELCPESLGATLADRSSDCKTLCIRRPPSLSEPGGISEGSRSHLDITHMAVHTGAILAQLVEV
jgi:hypothetical protein